VPLPCLFVRSVGVAELLGAIYLILPGLLRIRLRMAQLAAAGLMGIMIGSMVITLASR
jgi:DoxX-like family